MDKLIVAVGVNENVGRDENPHVPLTPAEIAEDVAACVEAGASIIHIHARDPKTGEPRMNDSDLYLEIYEETQRLTDALLYPTYPLGDTKERYRHVVALAESAMARLEIAPVISGIGDWGPGPASFGTVTDTLVLAEPLDDTRYQLEVARRYDLWVSHDVFEASGVRRVTNLWRHGYYHRPMLLKFFMSDVFAYGLPTEPRWLQTWVDMVPPDLDVEWLVLPYGVEFGKAMALWACAIATGGHVRVGIGDNPSTEGGFASTNAQRVRQVVDVASALGSEIATVADVRARFAPLPPEAIPTPPARGASGASRQMQGIHGAAEV